jgi:hypothetical protein
MGRIAISGKPYPTLTVAAAAFVVGLVAQTTTPARLVFAETEKLRLLVSAGRGLANSSEVIPKQLAAGAYSLDYARRVLVPSMGGSIAIGDFDGDGQPDLYVVIPGGSNSLFRNNGDGTFQDVTAKAGVRGTEGNLSAAFADYDRSGHPSLFVAGVDGVLLYHNNGNGRFSDVTHKAGLQSNPGELCTHAVLGDVDGDGLPDLLVTVYTDLNHPPTKPVFIFPNDFSGGITRLYRNDGNGAFTDVTAAAGLGRNPGRARNAIVADFNSDRRPDLLVLRDDKPPALYVNRGNGSFEDATWTAGAALTSHAFFDGVIADFDQDGKPDVALWSTIGFRVLLNDGNATFKRAESLSLLPPLANPFGFHGAVADLDGNGFPDVLTADNDGRWHVFANQAARFKEVPLLLSAGSVGRHGTPTILNSLPSFASVCPLRMEAEGGMYLLALRPDGRIMALERITEKK